MINNNIPENWEMKSLPDVCTEIFAGGDIQKQLTTPMVQNIQIPIPPMCEQERIVGVLDSVLADVDSAIEKTEQSYQHTADLFQSILQQKLTNDTWDKRYLG